jgi:hypothetical protein
VNASIFTLTAIAVDRYKAIIYPLRSHASKFRTKGSPRNRFLIHSLHFSNHSFWVFVNAALLKKVKDFPVASRDATKQLSLAGNN